MESNHFFLSSLKPSVASSHTAASTAPDTGTSMANANVNDADQSCGKHESPLRRAPSMQASTCYVCFSGFREDDEWNSSNGSSEEGNTSTNSRGNVINNHPSELDVYEHLAAQAGLSIQPTLLSSTNVLVARRGFTKKRLLAALHHMPVVLPQWVAEGCPRVSLSSPPVSTSEPAGPSTGSVTTSVDARYAVPWLHGYVFSTTGLTTQERTAIEHICAEQHGAVVEPSLTYRCDVLLTSAECIRELQDLLRRDALGTLASNTGSAQQQGKLRRKADAAIDAADTAKGGRGKKGKRQSDEENTVPSRNLDNWLTDKVRFALEFGIPVADYVKLFSLLRLDRLPLPTIGLHTTACLSAKTSMKPVKLGKEAEEALNGSDFDAVVSICRVATPAGGAARWRLLLERAAAVEATPNCGKLKRKGTNNDMSSDEGVRMSSDNDNEEMDSDKRNRNTSSVSASASSPSSASTVSDPDVWEDFMQHTLVPSWPNTDTDNAPLEVQQEQQEQQHLDPCPVRERFTKDTPSPVVKNFTLNTADVDVHLTASSAEAATLRVSNADYYFETGATNDGAGGKIELHLCEEADSYHDSRTSDYLTLGTSQVDPSPRLTTNALLLRGQQPRPPNESTTKATFMSTAVSKRGAPEESFCDRIAAYYAAQRSERPLSHRMPTAAAPWSELSDSLNSSPLATVDALSSAAETAANETFLAKSQMLVESCKTVEEGSVFRTSSGASAPAQLTRHPTVVSSFVARATLPIWAVHSPYLTVSLLGCSDDEERRARNWCGVCRFLRSPVPTIETDVVVLGSLVLVRKKYTVPSTHTAMLGKNGSCEKKQGGGLRAAAAHGKHKSKRTVSVRFWEMDAVVARVLADTCGIALNRLAPLRWLEDAAVASQKAAADASDVEKTKADLTDKAAKAEETITLTAVDRTTLETTSTPQETLADILHDRLAAVQMQQREEEKGDCLTPGVQKTEASVNASFHPLPALLPEQLPSLTSPSYYIRLRRSYATAVTATIRESTANTMAGDQISFPPTFAVTVRGTAGWQAAVLDVEEKQKQQLAQQPQLSLAASESTAGKPLFRRYAAESVQITPFNTKHDRNMNNDKSSSQQLRLENKDDFSLFTNKPTSSASSIDVSASANITSQAQMVHESGEAHVDKGKDEKEKPYSHDEELATAERRFNQLLALFVVEDGTSSSAPASSLKQNSSNNSNNSVTYKEERDVVEARRHVLQPCYFCCVDGDYTRVDWAVLRGLVRYGGGRVEKKSAEEWEQLLARPKEKRELQQLLQSKTYKAGFSREGEKGDSDDQRRLAARVRHNVEYEKGQRRLARLMLRAEELGNSTSDNLNNEKPVSVSLGNSALSTLTGGSDTTTTAATVQKQMEDDRNAIERLKLKLRNTALGCQQAPTFCLLPHSFQRAPVNVDKNRSTPTIISTENTTAGTATSSGQLHALRGLARVTQDYVYACLAVGSRLNPQSCFLFHTSIPSAPDNRFFHARCQTPLTQRKLQVNAKQKGRLHASTRTPQLGKPLLSAWMREKRYSKPESVGVCVAFLWGLPASDSRWVNTIQAVDATSGAKAAPPSVHLVSKTNEGTAKGTLVPSAHLVRLMRALLLGFRNAVEAMGGHVVDTFSTAAVTHVVVVDVDIVVSSSLEDFFTTADATAFGTHSISTPLLGGAKTGNRTSTSNYWPAEGIVEIVRSAAQQQLSLVKVDWLASCVEWGTFIDETDFPPPDDLHECIESYKLQQQQQRLKAQQQRLHASKQSLNHVVQHQEAPVQRRKSGLSSQSIRDGSAARAAEARKRHRTPSPTLSPSPHTATAPDASRITAAPYTPPRSWSSVSVKQEEQKEERLVPPLNNAPAPSLSIIPAHPATHLYDESSQKMLREDFADNRVHTPVMCRRLPPGSTSNSNSNAEPCTPPPRPPEFFFTVRDSGTQQHGQRSQNNHAHHRHNNSVTPSPRTRSHSALLPTAGRRSQSCNSDSNSAHRRYRCHHRGTSLSTSQQHNTFSVADQRDAEAYVEHLGSMFNFCSPGSTPLPSSARRGQQAQTATTDNVTQEAGEEEEEHTPLPKGFREHVMQQLFEQTLPSASPLVVARKENSLAMGMLTPPRAAQSSQAETQRGASMSCVLSTPRRRTLRTVAAAAAATNVAMYAAASSNLPSMACAPLDSPDQRRHRSGNAASSISDPALQILNGLPPTNDKHQEKGVTTNVEDTPFCSGSCVSPFVLGGGGSTHPSCRDTERRSDVLMENDYSITCNATSHEKGTNAELVAQEGTGVPSNKPLRHAGIENVNRDDEDAEVWVARTPPSWTRGATGDDEEVPPSHFPPHPTATNILCRFSDGGLLSEDETTVPLPRAIETSSAATDAVAADFTDGRPMIAESNSAMPNLSLKADAIPDMQPDALEGSEEEGCDVWAPATFNSTTESAYEALDEPGTASAKHINTRKPMDRVEDRKQQQKLVLAVDNEEEEEFTRQDTQQQQQEQRQQCTGTIDLGRTHCATSVAGETFINTSSRPRLGTCSLPRLPSPPPVLPSPSVRSVNGVTDVDVDNIEEEELEQNSEFKPVVSGTCNNVLSTTPSTVSPEAATTPWTIHRPLSLSRRTSRSPVPPPVRNTERPQHRKEKHSKAATAGTEVYPALKQDMRDASSPYCLSVYVLHNLPHRELRLQRCRSALQRLMQESHSPTTPTLVRPSNTESNNNNWSVEATTKNSRTGRETTNTTPGQKREDIVLPVRFVTRCEDADVCVTHEVNLRESVLVAIALGCWVVQPGFLECVAAILESTNSGHVCGGSALRTGANELHRLSNPRAQLPASGVSARTTLVKTCFQRLCEMCPIYEWTAANAGGVAAVASSPSPMLRSLVLQCRRQRQAAQAQLGHTCQCSVHERRSESWGEQELWAARHARSAGGPANIFPHYSFLLLSAVFTPVEAHAGEGASEANATASRIHAICRLLVAGGGDALSVAQIGCVSAPVASRNGTKQRQTAALTSGAQHAKRELLCCWCCCLDRDSGFSNMKKTLASDVSAGVGVTDARLYRDLLYLLCDAVYRYENRDVNGSKELSTGNQVKGVSHIQRRYGGFHSKKWHSDMAAHNDPLVVLLDVSLFPTAGGAKVNEEGCYVTLANNYAVAATQGERSVQQRHNWSRHPENENSVNAQNANDQAEGSAPASIGTLSGTATTLATLPVGTWLLKWLSSPESEEAEEKSDNVCGYARAARHAMCAHLSACCSLIRHLHEIRSLTDYAFNSSEAGMESLSSSLVTLAESKWSYKVSDIPFQPPTLDEVLSVFACNGDSKADVLLPVQAVARAWEKANDIPHYVEFRCTSWAGACVAAGGSAEIAAASEADKKPASSEGMTGVADSNAWMRECDAQTLIAVVSYA